MQPNHQKLNFKFPLKANKCCVRKREGQSQWVLGLEIEIVGPLDQEIRSSKNI